MEVLADEDGVAFACKPFEGLKWVCDVLKGSSGVRFCDASEAIPGLGFPSFRLD